MFTPFTLSFFFPFHNRKVLAQKSAKPWPIFIF
jgi:hypothetical protein